MKLVRLIKMFVSKTVLRNEYSSCFYFYSLSRHVSAYLMAILRCIIQNIERSRCYYKGSVVLVQLYVSCRQLIVVVLLCIKYFVKK
jgi:hypothetical protein